MNNTFDFTMGKITHILVQGCASGFNDLCGFGNLRNALFPNFLNIFIAKR
jgi:hypothetical protein